MGYGKGLPVNQHLDIVTNKLKVNNKVGHERRRNLDVLHNALDIEKVKKYF